MAYRATPRAELRDEFTGLVAASLAVAPDVDAGTVPCRDCIERERIETSASSETPTLSEPPEPASETAQLGSGDRVTATLTCYGNYSWEVLGVFCGAHAVASVERDMGVTAEDQAVIEATLERTGYRSPLGEFFPNALTFGAVDVLDYSPAADGY